LVISNSLLAPFGILVHFAPVKYMMSPAMRAPVVVASAAETRTDPVQRLDTPIGAFRIGGGWGTSTSVAVVQPIVDVAGARYGAGAARREADAADRGARRFEQELETAAVEAFLDVVAIDARLGATGAFIASLRGRLAEAEAKVAEGRALPAEALKVRLALEGPSRTGCRLAPCGRSPRSRSGTRWGSTEGSSPCGTAP